MVAYQYYRLQKSSTFQMSTKHNMSQWQRAEMQQTAGQWYPHPAWHTDIFSTATYLVWNIISRNDLNLMHFCPSATNGSIMQGRIQDFDLGWALAGGLGDGSAPAGSRGTALVDVWGKSPRSPKNVTLWGW